MTRRLLLALSLAIAVGMVAAACSGDADPDSGTTVDTFPDDTTQVTSVPPITTTTQPPPVFASPDEALAYIIDFDATSEDAGGIKAALALIGGHFPGLPLPRFVEDGSQAVRDAVLAVLARPSAQNAQILVAMDTYGAPSGTPAVSARWSPIARVKITGALQTALTYFGDLAPVAQGVHREVLADQLSRCEPTGCGWPGAYYDPPIVVMTLDGVVAGEVFTGTIGVRAGTEVTTEHDVTMERVLDQWVIVDGYLATTRPPALVITDPLNGSISSEAIIPVSGVSEEGVVVSVAGDSFEIDLGQFWMVAVTLEPGWNDIVVTARGPSGETSVASTRLRYEPTAQRQLGYIRQVTATSITFDAATLLFGAEADQAARDAGVIGENETLPNGFFIANPDATDETLPLAPDVFTVLVSDDTTDPVSTTPSAFRQFLAAGGVGRGLYGGDPAITPYWMVILDGTVIQIEQQYLP